ncbi:MAG: hypothetical protein AAF957_07615 [Planctomycetota bacterium]
MLDRRERGGLALEALQRLLGVEQPEVEDLDRHLPAEVEVGRRVDDAHRAGAEPLVDPVAAGDERSDRSVGADASRLHRGHPHGDVERAAHLLQEVGAVPAELGELDRTGLVLLLEGAADQFGDDVGALFGGLVPGLVGHGASVREGRVGRASAPLHLEGRRGGSGPPHGLRKTEDA